MNAIRRGLLVIALTLGVLVTGLAATLPAYASFSDSAGTGMTLGTANVAAPTNVVGGLTCGSTYVKSTPAVSWTASTSARVSAYVVTVYWNDGYSQSASVAGTATSWSAATNTINVVSPYQVQYSVTTKTDYGWTKESARTGWFHC